jgi:hypothetical protein
VRLWRGPIAHGLSRDLQPEQGGQGGIPLAAGAAAGGPPDRLGLLEHLRDRRAGQDVVELLEQQRPPVDQRHRLRWSGAEPWPGPTDPIAAWDEGRGPGGGPGRALPASLQAGQRCC